MGDGICQEVDQAKIAAIRSHPDDNVIKGLRESSRSGHLQPPLSQTASLPSLTVDLALATRISREAKQAHARAYVYYFNMTH